MDNNIVEIEDMNNSNIIDDMDNNNESVVIDDMDNNDNVIIDDIGNNNESVVIKTEGIDIYNNDEDEDVDINLIIKETVKLGDKFWKEYKSKKFNINDTDSLDKYHYMMQTNYKEFCKAYPLVIKYMIYQTSYSSKAFYRYLLWMNNNVPKSRDDTYKVIAEYAPKLYQYRKFKGKKQRFCQKTCNNIRTMAYKSIKKQFEDQMEQVKNAKENYEKYEEECAIQRKRELLNKLRRILINEDTPELEDVPELEDIPELKFNNINLMDNVELSNVDIDINLLPEILIESDNEDNLLPEILIEYDNKDNL